MADSIRAFRGTIVHCLKDPGADIDNAAVEVLNDGVLLVDGGKVAALGSSRKNP